MENREMFKGFLLCKLISVGCDVHPNTVDTWIDEFEKAEGKGGIK